MSEVGIQFDSIDESVSERFAHVAGRMGAKIAVDDGSHRYTYARLLALADAWAREIDARVAQSGRVVAVFMPTDAPHIAAVLAILQSGRIYLSLDPAYPAVRLRDMMAAADVSLVITTASLRSRVDELGARAVLEVDPTSQREIAQTGEARATHARSSPESFACLYFTSGSTGTPKAVVHTHRNILFDIRRQTHDMCVTARDRFDLLFSASFSAFLSPVFGALLTGGSVHPFNLKAHPPEALRDWLRREFITVSTMSVSSFRILVSVLEPHRDFPALRFLSVGAEPLALQDLHAFRKHFDEGALMQNALATTETRTIAQICYPGTGPLPAQMTVGGAVDGKKLSLRDERDHEVAPGEVGEIVVESAVISPGTWQTLRDQPDARLAAPHVTIHRTGDLARQLSDGQIVHLGRIDTQVKIRGHRIEVGEIESALLAHASVKDVAVFAADAGGEREMLVALVVPREGVACDGTSLRQHLLVLVPDYMVPNRFVATGALPATPTGKLDRKHLPAALAQIDANARATNAATTSPALAAGEVRVLEIWRDVLRRATLGPDDDFFDAGGDSLSATRLAARLTTLAGTQVAPGLLLEAPTARRMSAHLEAMRPAPSPLVPVQLQRGREDSAPLYLFPPWTSGSVLFRHLAHCENSGTPLIALEGGDDPAARRRVDSIEEIAALYVDALLDLHSTGPFAIGGYSMSGFIAWEVARRLAAIGRTPQVVVLLDCPKLYSFCSAEDGAWITRVTSLRGRISSFARLLGRPEGISRVDLVAQMVRASVLRARWHVHDRWFPSPVPAWEADYRRNIELSVRYRVQPYDGVVVLVRARAQADWFNRVQHDLGWTNFCRGPFSIVDLPGDHHAMFVEPGVHRLSRVLQAAVAGRAGRRAEFAPT